MIEVENINADTPIRQGDIIRRKNLNEIENEEDIRVIVTADCDLAREKAANLTVVRGHTLRSHFAHDLGGLVINGIRSEVVNTLAKRINNKIKEKDTEFSGISKDAVREWVRRIDFQTAKDQCSKVYGIDIPDNLSVPWQRAGKTYEVEECIECEERIRKIRDLQRTGSEKVKKLEKLCREFVENPPGDKFIVTVFEDYPFQNYVVDLRNIGNMQKSEIRTNISSVKEAGCHFDRICKLRGPFKYYFIQRFASVFYDFGVPDEYFKKNENLTSILGHEE